MGSPATGPELRKITNAILMCLDNELIVEDLTEGDLELTMPEIEWDMHKLKSHIKDMESVEFWQQKGI